MAWLIKCNNRNCKHETWVNDIVRLIKDHRDPKGGWFICEECNNHGYIEKSFSLQEKGKFWKPYLRGIITLGNKNESYQPFVFMVSYKRNDECNDVWFSYYKDTRKRGGRLKLGYGPGGPPVLNKESIKLLLKSLKEIDYL